MDIKANYYKMSEDEFNNYLDGLKTNSSTIHLLNDTYFFVLSQDILQLTINLNRKMFELESVFNSFTEFAKKQIIQYFLIDEIEATNKIENISSTKHDIFSIINDASFSKDKRIVAISNAYNYLLKTKGTKIESLADIRKMYDVVLKGAISPSDMPDGVYFRKESVYIIDVMKSIHTGVIGEDNINKSMEEFVSLYNSKNELFIKMTLCHFMFEYIHPFYDGNGRLGRFLFSNGIYLETQSPFAFIIASAMEHDRKKYYKSFKVANDRHEFGCLNDYVEMIIDILIEQADIITKKLTKDKETINNYKPKFVLTKSEEKIFRVICEASVLSCFGVSNKEIMSETEVSKRTLIYSLNKFKNEMKMVDTKIGKIMYHKFEIQNRQKSSY